MANTVDIPVASPLRDCVRALHTLPKPLNVEVRDTGFFAKISDDWFCLVTPEDTEDAGWVKEYLHGDDWGVMSESVGQALLLHYTRPLAPSDDGSTVHLQVEAPQRLVERTVPMLLDAVGAGSVRSL